MGQRINSDDISLSDLRKDVADYSWETFRADLLAGLNVAFLTLPQAMAYALLAGLPLSCGIFAAIYASIVAALFSSSKQLVIGPNNTVAILIQSGTAQILYTYYRDLVGLERDLMALQILAQLTFLTGILQIVAAWCRLGRLTQFVSYSVIIGYMIGTMLAVMISQFYIFLGVPKLSGVHSLYENGVYLISHVHDMQWTTTLVGLTSVFFIILLKKINKNIPAALITFAFAGIAVDMLGLSSYSASSLLAGLDVDELSLPNVHVVGDTGEVYDILPHLSFPFFNFRIMNGLLPIACAIALLGVIDTTSVAKTIAANTGQRLSNNQEIFGLGIGNLISSFIGGMPVSGSPSRSGLNYRSGGLTRFSAIFNAIFVCLFVYLCSFFVTRIPLTTLAALVLVTAAGIVNKKQLLFCVRSTISDAFVLWTTLLACMFFSLDIAFYIGVTLSITLYLKTAAMPQLTEYTIEDNGDLRCLNSNEASERKAIRVMKIEGELFFGAADLFQTTLKSFAEGDTNTQVIILQLKNARDMDATSCYALKQLHEYLRGSQRHLIACGMTKQVWDVLNHSGLADMIGKQNLFAFDESHPQQHMQYAINRAKELCCEQSQQVQEQEKPAVIIPATA